MVWIKNGESGRQNNVCPNPECTVEIDGKREATPIGRSVWVSFFPGGNSRVDVFLINPSQSDINRAQAKLPPGHILVPNIARRCSNYDCHVDHENTRNPKTSKTGCCVCMNGDPRSGIYQHK
ncbi:MAG: hypothetical protein NT135_03535 [Candidatus Berkelbacteria bacterium]|nr:hypothetical protein [Candidatus Berkelbacteria bacterium]